MPDHPPRPLASPPVTTGDGGFDVPPWAQGICLIILCSAFALTLCAPFFMELVK